MARWPTDHVPGYQGAHDRVRAARGRADAHPCADCGRPAQQWSYNRSGVAEVKGTKNGWPVVYSTDPEQYDPCCRSCNRRRDQPIKTHCKRGHPLSGDTVRLSSSGRRVCIPCANDYARDYYLRRKDRP